MWAVRVLLTAPQIGRRSCAECRAFLFHEHGPQAGEPVTRGGRRIPRAPGSKPPCVTCPKTPPGVEPCPENAAEMTPLIRRVYDHYRECLAVNWQVPEASDPIVRFHAGLLRQVEDAVGRSADARRLAQLLTRGRE